MHRTHHLPASRFLAPARLLTPALVLAALGLLVALSPARAQEAGTMVIEVPDPEALEPGSTWTDFGIGRLIVFVGERACADVDVPPGGDVEIVLGEAGQPAACATAGAEVLFVNGLGQWLAASTTFTPGDRFVLDDFLAPRPPGTPYPAFVCAHLDDQGIEVTACEAIGPPGAGDGAPVPAPAGHGPAALAEQAHLSALDVVAILVALALAVGVARGTTRQARH